MTKPKGSNHLLTADLLLLLTSLIWGFAFVAQRAGMTHMGPFTFNAIRFLVGGLLLLGVSSLIKKWFQVDQKPERKTWRGAIITGMVLFAAASLQQVGLVDTTAGKAGFITGLYVVLVPIFGIVIGKKTSLLNWVGAVLATLGLFFISVRSGFIIDAADITVLLGAVLWAMHVHLVGHYTPKVGAVRLATTQFLVCGALSLVSAFVFEKPSLSGIVDGWLTLAYGSILSVGVAYTLQVIAQRKTDPSLAAIIMSLESVFAALGGWLILHEKMDTRGIIGAALMFMGMLVSQFQKQKYREPLPEQLSFE